MTIYQWPDGLKPREKLLTRGADALSDAEVLAIILRTGTRQQDAVALSAYLIRKFGSLGGVFTASREALCEVKGLGEVKYIQLQAVLELAKRYCLEDVMGRPVMSSASEAKRFLQLKMRDLGREVFACLFLDAQHHVLAFEELFQGTLQQAPVFPRELARSALAHNAAAVILAHNHPSGVTEPSQADVQITEVVADTLALLDVRVLDHFIIAGGSVYSFAENGRI